MTKKVNVSEEAVIAVEYRNYLKNGTRLKIILPFVLFILTVVQVSAQDRKNDWEKENLKRKIKSIEKHHYEVTDKYGKIVKGTYKGAVVNKYDRNGNIIENSFYNSDRSLELKSIEKYDKKGNQIEAICYFFDGKLNWKCVYKYDNKGNQIEANTYNSDGSLRHKRTYEYDKKGKQIEQSFQESYRIINNYYEYGKKGNLIKDSIYFSSGGSGNTIYQYDKKRNKIEEDYYFDRNPSIKSIYKYDKEGNEIEKSRYNSDGSLDYKFIYEYKYDKKGNWVEMIQYEGEAKNPIQIIERKIEYYE